MTIDPGFITEVKRRSSLVELIGASVALKPSSRGEWKGLCPFHKEKTASFYVIESKGFFHCFGCGEHGDIVGWVRKTLTANNFTEAVEHLAHRAGLRPTGPSLEARPIVQRPSDEMLAERQARRRDNARLIWSRCQSPHWTPADRYWQNARRLRIAMPPTLRFHPGVDHPFLKRGHPFPALVAAIQRADPEHEKHIVAVHCIYLAQDGAKMPCPPGFPPGEWNAKITRGDMRGGAVRLTAAEDLMVIAEGIETAGAVLQSLWDDEHGVPHIDGQPVGVWAALSQGNMGSVVLPAGVREVILAADADGKRPDAGDDRRDPEAIVQAAAARHRDQGRNVRIAWPPAGSDFNDLVPEGAGAAGAAGEVGEAA